jgi:hypothetical protein
MVLIPARTQVRWLALRLSAVLTFIAFASADPVTATKSAEADQQTASVSASDTNADGDEIRRLIAKYSESIEEADTTLASQIWSDSPEVSFIHPLGHEHGLEQIKQNVYRHLMGDTFSERKLSVHDASAHVYGDSGWAEFYWDFNAKFRKDGFPITHGRGTRRLAVGARSLLGHTGLGGTKGVLTDTWDHTAG